MASSSARCLVDSAWKRVEWQDECQCSRRQDESGTTDLKVGLNRLQQAILLHRLGRAFEKEVIKLLFDRPLLRRPFSFRRGCRIDLSRGDSLLEGGSLRLPKLLKLLLVSGSEPLESLVEVALGV
jgi:hypothetical protein